MSAPACCALCGSCRDGAWPRPRICRRSRRSSAAPEHRFIAACACCRRIAARPCTRCTRSAGAVDDIADDEGSLAEKRAGLDAWRARIAALYAGGVGDDAVTRVLRAAIDRFRSARTGFPGGDRRDADGRGGADRRAGSRDARFVLRSRRLRSGTAVGARVRQFIRSRGSRGVSPGPCAATDEHPA